MARLVAASRAILCAVVTITSFEAIARAERRPVVVIELVNEPDGQKLQTVLREALTAHSELKPLVDPVVPSLLTGSLVDDEDAGLHKEALAHRDQAEAALSTFDLAVAGREATYGLDALTSISPGAAVPILADLAIVEGQKLLGESNASEAAKWFTLVHRLTPKRRLDSAHYLPEVIAAFDQPTPTSQTPSALEVHGSRGRVFIDGTDVGVPNATFEVAPGIHIVHIAGPERQPRGVLVDVPALGPGAPAKSVAIADATANTDLLITRARVALAHATDPVARTTTMKNLAALISRATNTKILDAILILRLNNKLVAQGWRDHAPGFDAPIFNKPVDASKAHADPLEVLAWFAPPRALQPFDGRDKLPPPEPAWYEKRWVQASAVSALIVIVLGGYLYSQRGGGMNEVNQMVGWRP